MALEFSRPRILAWRSSLAHRSKDHPSRHIKMPCKMVLEVLLLLPTLEGGSRSEAALSRLLLLRSSLWTLWSNHTGGRVDGAMAEATAHFGGL